MTRLARPFLVALVAALAATLLAAAPSSARPADMGTARAGRYYLSVTCPENRAFARFEHVIWHGRRVIPLAEVNRRLPQVTRATRIFASALQRWAGKLFNPPDTWPSGVVRYVNRLATAGAREAGLRAAAGAARSGREWVKFNNRANKVSYGNLGSIVRAHLNLPPPGQGC